MAFGVVESVLVVFVLTVLMVRGCIEFSRYLRREFPNG